MFIDMIEYDCSLSYITSLGMNEAQVDTLLLVINENPTLSNVKLIEIADQLVIDQKIILGTSIYYTNPMMNESTTISLLEFTIPAILNNIPYPIIEYLTESHARIIVDKILSMDIDSYTTGATIEMSINEMFSSGAIAIPVQGLRKEPSNVGLVINGIFAPMLNKSIVFTNGHIQIPDTSRGRNNKFLKGVLSTSNENTALMNVLPKYVVTLKNMIKDK